MHSHERLLVIKRISKIRLTCYNLLSARSGKSGRIASYDVVIQLLKSKYI